VLFYDCNVYVNWAVLCSDRQALVDCYLPHIRPTQSCTEAFDKYFRNFISEKQYRNACRYDLLIQVRNRDRCDKHTGIEIQI